MVIRCLCFQVCIIFLFFSWTPLPSLGRYFSFFLSCLGLASFSTSSFIHTRMFTGPVSLTRENIDRSRLMPRWGRWFAEFIFASYSSEKLLTDAFCSFQFARGEGLQRRTKPQLDRFERREEF